MTFKAQSKLVLFLVSLSSLILILFNFYSSEINAGLRSYINGESIYSKGQKDALLNLTYYLNTKNSIYWEKYKESLSIPMSDNMARHAMVKKAPDSIAYNYFVKGQIHPNDIDNIIWMFKNFGEIKEFKEAVALWSKSEVILYDINKYAEEFNEKVEKGMLDVDAQQHLASEISLSNSILTKLETDFSNVLSDLARKVEKLLKWVNVLVTILIVGSLSTYLLLIIAKLYKSSAALKESYDKVSDLNLELDTFVYSLSHDLRSPLTSLQGLVRVSFLDTDIELIKENMSLMDKLLDKQDLFIKDVIALLQRRNLTPQPQIINLKDLLEDAFLLNKHNSNTKEINTEIQIDKDLEEIYNDIVFIKIIINNLVSNSFKYSDSLKEQPFIIARVKKLDGNLIIEIIDNGIGISKEYHEKVFEMFYILDSRKRGTGLGLYIIRQSVEKLGGKIHLESTLGKGSHFTITLPKLN